MTTGLQVLVVLLLALSSGSGAHAQTEGDSSGPTTATPSAVYPNILDAGKSETWLLWKLANPKLSPECDLFCWMQKPQIKELSARAENGATTGTIFLPQSERAFERQAASLCMSTEAFIARVSNDSKMSADFLSAAYAPGKSIYSKDFKEGMVFKSWGKTNFTLSKLPSGKWGFKESSSLATPGGPVRADLTIEKTDIKAGNAVMHLVDLPPRVGAYDSIWQGWRKEALKAAGLPEDSIDCPRPPGLPIGVYIGLAVAAAFLAICLIGVLVWAQRAGHCTGLKKQLQGAFCCRSKKDNAGTPHEGPDPEAPASAAKAAAGAGGASSAYPKGPAIGHGDTSLHLDQHQQGSPHHNQLLAAAAVGPPASPIYVNAGASSSAASSTMLPSYSSGPSISDGPLGGPQGSARYALAGALSGVDDRSPFAAMFAGSAGSPFGLEASRSVAAVTGQPSSGSSSRSGSRGTASTHGGNSSNSRQQQQYRSNNNSNNHSAGYSGGSDPQNSGRDRVSPLPELTVNTYQLNQLPMDEASNEAAASYAGGLMPTHSMPIGQIPHALIVPYNELQLDECIGSGAEGKVYRGTWKHTDIAAKEYLPHHDCMGDTGSPLSDTAKAAAQAALAKEVYMLTRLNHPNLVRFCAVCLERPLVVMEYYKNGSVFGIIRNAEQQMGDTAGTFMQQNCCSYLNWDRRLMMLHDVAAGMSYLHGRNHIHGDLRSPNLFVGADGKVKIGDFGFTKRLGLNKASLRVARITHPRWVSPELLMHNILSRASDVYSFGIIMYELLTFKVPFEDYRKEQVVLEVMRGQRPEVPAEYELPPGTSSSTCLWSYVRLMEECWAQDPSQRPSFEVIARRLKAMQRWRRIINRLQPHVEQAITRRTRSMPAMGRNGVPYSTQAGGLGPGMAAGGRTQSAASASSDESQEPARRIASAPAAATKGRVSLAEALRAGLLGGAGGPPSMLPQLPALQPNLPPPGTQHWRGVSSIPEGESDQQQQERWDAEQQRRLDALYGDDLAASVCVSSTVVGGTRLAIIPTGPATEEQDALASIVSPEAIAEAKRVLVVASDLPSSYERRPRK